MSDFDYEYNKVVGVAKKKYPGDKYASIHPLGYVDKNSHFQAFGKEDISAIFTPNETIFGNKVPDHLLNELICFSINESEVTDDSTKDFFCRVYNSRIYTYEHTPIKDASIQELKEDVSQGLYNRYYKVDNRIHYTTKSDVQKGITMSWLIEDTLFKKNPNLCRFEDNIYLIRGDINNSSTYTDIMSKEEIVKFVIELIKLYNLDPRNIMNISSDLIKKVGLPADILQFRFKEFNLLLPSIELTYKNIVDLASNPILSDILQRSIKAYEDEYIKRYEDHHQKVIKEFEESKELKIKEINDELESKRGSNIKVLQSLTSSIEKQQSKLNDILFKIKKREEEVEALELRFAEIEIHKGRLIEDFSMIKDVIGSQFQCGNSVTKNDIDSVVCEGVNISELKEFLNHIVNHLLKNGFSDSAEEIALNISKLFFAKNRFGNYMSVILLPCLMIFKSFIDAIGTYKLCSIGVAPNWKSYDDLQRNGLDGMIDSAINNPNEIHIVLLQNINLSYIPSYMQPINDVLIGIRKRLPGKHNILGVPSNLWIFGTRTSFDEEAMPISISNIEEFGCVEFKEYTCSEDNRDITPKPQFITMDFVTAQRADERGFKSYPNSYLD